MKLSPTELFKGKKIFFIGETVRNGNIGLFRTELMSDQ